MKRIVLIIMLFSVSCFANNINYFEENNSIGSSENIEDDPANPPIELEPTVPISDYQYTLLVLALGVGVYGISKNKRHKFI